MTAKLSKPDIDAEARAWFVRLLQEPTARNRATFEAWRQADPAHAEAFRAVALTWEAAEQPGKRLAEAEADELSVYLKAMDGAKDRRKSSRRLAGAAVILACLLGTAVWLERPNMLQDFAADYVSSRGERLEIRLADGSTVLLDADSALADDFSEGERQVRLLRGGAFFEVQHDPQHPFKVIAADGEVRVLGTRFEVRLLEDSGVGRGERVSLLVNSLGATPLEELYIVFRRLRSRLSDKGIDIVSPLVGRYATSMEMAGVTLTLCRLDSEIERLLAAPCDCPFWRN